MRNKLFSFILSALLGVGVVLLFARGLRCEPSEVTQRIVCFLSALLLSAFMIVLLKRIHFRLGAVAISLWSLFLTFIAFDLTFALFPRSHSAGYTLAHLRWHQLYYTPFENKHEYRDRNYTEEELNQGNAILVVGDSFVAGSGVNKLEDRFSSVLQTRVGNKHMVVNWGKPGNETPDETKRLQKLDFKPGIIVLSYFGNDIGKAWGQAGNVHPVIDPYAGLSEREKWWVIHSYVINYFYWLKPRTDLQAMWNFLFQSWKSEVVLEIHKQEMKDLFTVARDKSTKVFLVVFPFLQSPEHSDYVDWVMAQAKENGVPALDVRTLITDLEVKDRIVNYNDAHPSILVHKRVGEALEKKLSELGWLTH